MADIPTGDPNREVAIVFTVKGDSEQKAGGLSKAFEGVHRASEQASARVGMFARSAALGALAAMGLSYGLREMLGRAKEVNLSLEDMQKRVAGSVFAFAHWKVGTSGLAKWNESMREGSEIVEKLRGPSNQLKISREELAGVYAKAEMIGARYNMTQAQTIDLTTKLGAAQKVLGVDAEMAAMIIERAALSGSIMARSQLGIMLRANVGDMKAFKKASESVRLDKLKKALGDMVPAAEQMGKGMRGALFDIHVAAEGLFRDLSAPLFKEQTSSLREWAANMTQVRESGKSIAHEYGEKIAKAFTFIKDVSGSIAQHWEVIGGLFVANKIGGMLSGMGRAFAPVGGVRAGGVGGMLGGSVASMTVQAANVTVNSTGIGGALGTTTAAAVNKSTASGFSKFASGLARGASQSLIAAEAVGALAIAAAAFVDEWQTGKLKEQRVSPVQTMNALHAGLTAMKLSGDEQARHLRSVSEAFGLKTGQHVSAKSIETGLRTMDKIDAGNLALRYGFGKTAQFNAGGSMADTVAFGIAKQLNELIDRAVKGYGIDKESEDKSNKEKAKKLGDVKIGTVNITQDFKEADPDRVFHRVISEINQLGHAQAGSSAENR
jgi:hypothetical protein